MAFQEFGRSVNDRGDPREGEIMTSKLPGRHGHEKVIAQLEQLAPHASQIDIVLLGGQRMGSVSYIVRPSETDPQIVAGGLPGIPLSQIRKLTVTYMPISQQLLPHGKAEKFEFVRKDSSLGEVPDIKR